MASLAEFIKTLPEELQHIPEVFYAPYGFKIVEIKGRKLWAPGTFEDYQQFQAKRLGVDASTVKPKTGDSICYNSSPTTCAGQCPGGESVCGGEVSPGGYVGCGCFS